MEINEESLIKVTWSEVRSKVSKLDHTFSKIIDDLDPDQSFPLYLAYYPFGALIADPQQMYLPKINNKVYPITDQYFSKKILNDLGYGKDSWAMGLVLEKNIEVFIDFKEEKTSIPWLIYKPGTFFPFAKTLSKRKQYDFAPNNILTIVSGARSTFMLPNIGCLTNHVNLQKNYLVKSPPPKTLYEHWFIFKEIINSEVSQSKWRSCLLYFSEKWMNFLHHDSAWLKLKMYLHELAWDHFEYRRNYIYYDIAFSKIQKKRNLKPNPYLLDTASHLYKTALGAAPGYIPANNNESLPINDLQKAFVEAYGLKKYHPTIIQPTHFILDDKFPVYYSLQNPSTFVFSPKSRKLSSTLFEMHELRHIMSIFQEELTKENTICAGTIISEITKEIDFNYFHNEIDNHKVIKPSCEILKEDNRFINSVYKYKNSTFSTDAKFLRGCISIRPKTL